MIAAICYLIERQKRKKNILQKKTDTETNKTKDTIELWKNNRQHLMKTISAATVMENTVDWTVTSAHHNGN